MSTYAVESFTADERELLSRYFTNLDGPVFVLTNLPEVVKGALFARYSRSAKSLRRLFLDEFVDDLDVTGDTSLDATIGLRRAEQLYERVFGEYGDDSVAQLGGVHIACEQSSNILTKILERGRLMAYLEQSTRYVPYDSRLPTGHYRYRRDPHVLASPIGAGYVGEMDRIFDCYAELLPEVQRHVAKAHPRTEGISDIAYRQSVRAKALDAVRGLLPAGALSNLGIYGTGQSFELLLLRMRSHPLPEAREYAAMMLDELRKVIPSFLTRIDRPDRGGEWSAYFAASRTASSELVESICSAELDPFGDDTPAGASVRLAGYDPDGEDRVVAAIVYEHGHCSAIAAAALARRLPPATRAELVDAYVGERRNRRHRPGRAFEATSYQFDIVSDYGAFRDMQRHRMATVEWQPLTTSLGYAVPDLVEEAGLGRRYRESMDRSAALHELLRPDFPEQAAYAIALGYNIRYSMEMSAREAMHVIELRSGVQGHPSYRVIAQQMHRLIEHDAGHKLIASAMRFVDHDDHLFARLDAERRAELRRSDRPDLGGRHRSGGHSGLDASSSNGHN
jgi:thymidylate synthase ThyX